MAAGRDPDHGHRLERHAVQVEVSALADPGDPDRGLRGVRRGARGARLRDARVDGARAPARGHGAIRTKAGTDLEHRAGERGSLDRPGRAADELVLDSRCPRVGRVTARLRGYDAEEEK